MKAGHHDDAMTAVDEGVALVEASGERYYSAELHRLHGELFWHVWTIALALLAVIFNPVLPAHLTRPVWSVLNVLGALLLIAHLWVEREHNWQSRR